MKSSDGVKPEIDFSPVKKKRYEQYNSELCVFCHKSVSVGSLGRETFQGLCLVKITCKLRLENDPREYVSKDIGQILQSSVNRKTKLRRQCYQRFTNQNKFEILLSNQQSETESVVKGAFKSQDKRLISGKRPTNHFF